MEFRPKEIGSYGAMLERWFYFVCPNCFIETRLVRVMAKIDNEGNVSSDNSEIEKLVSELRKEK